MKHYIQLTRAYLRLLQRSSPKAAEVIIAIKREHGAYAAYTAAFIMSVYQAEIDVEQALPDESRYAKRLNGMPFLTPHIREMLVAYLDDFFTNQRNTERTDARWRGDAKQE